MCAPAPPLGIPFRFVLSRVFRSSELGTTWCVWMASECGCRSFAARRSSICVSPRYCILRLASGSASSHLHVLANTHLHIKAIRPNHPRSVSRSPPRTASARLATPSFVATDTASRHQHSLEIVSFNLSRTSIRNSVKRSLRGLLWAGIRICICICICKVSVHRQVSVSCVSSRESCAFAAASITALN